MDDNVNQRPTGLTNQHATFKAGLDERQEANNLYVVLELIRQIQISQPDKATVQSTFNLITQILPALGNVASKKDLEYLSERIGKIESAMGTIAQTSALNDRDVQQLKEGLSTIKESLRLEAGRLERAGESTGNDIKDLRKAIEVLSTEVGKVRAENSKYLLTTVLAIIGFIVAMATIFLKPTSSPQQNVSPADPTAAASPRETITKPAINNSSAAAASPR